MEARDVMTPEPACCSPSASVKDVAALMVANDCGEIPVVDEAGRLVGVVTDRDIACRCVAEGKSSDTPVDEVMSSSLVTVAPDTSIGECCKKMEDNQIRRLPVVDEEGRCCGIVSQADIALHASKDATGDLVREVSLETKEQSTAGSC
ncbi:MAG: CBS domain-containing protein [Pseudomonadota bacterium]